ncbi:MAG TPA: valine--tRNA ligase [Geobacterales bacterium]|nr:valine--tRNA ligase [Geobacterales bacterium]
MLRNYDYKFIEQKWQKIWENGGIYRFDPSHNKVYAIDTPPPYPTGELTPGNALNYIYCDIVARYKRMKGYSVLFPIGFDCHGLPTEVRVENIIKKKRNEVDWREFKELCSKYTDIWIEAMVKDYKRLGISFDWKLKYVTKDPSYWRKVQLSFILMYRKGLIYRAEHPVYWCPRCETAIAEAEVEYNQAQRELYYIKFTVADRDLIIATTRPELLAAIVAVAVHPEDERYQAIIGKIAKAPLYEREVPIIATPEVDPNFGTGAMMICTYGDKRDFRLQKRYKLPFIKLVNKNGTISEEGRWISGLRIEEARKKIVEMLREQNLLIKQEMIMSEQGTCWRCHTPVEIIAEKQWFVATTKLASKILEIANKEIRWIPEYQYKRLEDWVNSLDWDWVISRQRVFATPIPIWYCKSCGETIVADESWIPIDPRLEPPKIEKCPRCGAKEFEGEKDVMDTWMDSSITCAVHAGWPDNFDERLLPADLQPNGYDIIRTWDYYLLARHLALFNKPAFKLALINGMVRGTDGRMMHKSYGNVIPLAELLDRYGVDAFRLWASGSVKTGSDVTVRFEDLDFNKRFLIKLWNAAKYVLTYTKPVNEEIKVEKLIDKWILNELHKTINKINNAMEEFQFFEALNELRSFVWDKFCDEYLEAIKYRTAKEDKAAYFVARYVLFNIIILLAPFAPFITEEIFEYLEKGKSVHQARYPESKPIDEEAIQKGGIIVGIISELRRKKVASRVSLASPIKKVTIFSKEFAELLKEGYEDIKNVLRIEELNITSEGRGNIESEALKGVTYDITFS